MVAAYGGECACCGESIKEFLTIDHINGDGAKDRKIRGVGHTFYRWLRKNNWPQGRLQLLCWNCNCSKGTRGYCPHVEIFRNDLSQPSKGLLPEMGETGN